MKIFSAIAGAVIGFYLGFFVAAQLGLHEKQHVFPVAGACGFIVGMVFLAGANRFPENQLGKFLMPAFAIGALVVFFKTIYR